MLIRRGNPNDIKSSEITPESVYLNRRDFMTVAAAGSAAALVPGTLAACSADSNAQEAEEQAAQLKPNSWEEITTYNNFYEFGTGKDEPHQNARNFKTRPWTIAVEGHVKKPAVYNLEDFIKPHTIEDRTYRLRCVEAWSMVIPWRGFALRDLVSRVAPTSQARFIEFETLYDPRQMPGQQRGVLDWPYNEGLRLDEAMHPLAFMVTGLYGRELPNQNGAPLRLVVPWKYGFKSIKSIVKLRFLDKQPVSSWTKSAPEEYGFYANVNPAVDHPRWSQKSERPIGEFRRKQTQLFNGYMEVAPLYTGLDLTRNY